jgi:NRAMP (natural resistance-associated macrophage protein)-like metal ion transporter
MSAIKDPISNVSEQRLTAHLDSAHVGDIKGAWGVIDQKDTARRKTWFARLLTLLVIMGPGLVTMVADNDAGGVQTYLQAGQNYGTSLLWTLLLLIPVLIVNQEMVVRLGAVSGVGHARLIFERFGKFWGAFSVGDLFLLNFLTIVTEFIGFSMALQYFGVSPYLSVPIGVVGLIVITATGSFRRWEGVMWICAAVSFLMIPLALIPHPTLGPIVHDTFIPGVRGGVDSTALLTIIAIVGTTVAPWQLFFQQSNIVDKRLTPRWIKHEQLDTTIGAFITNITAAGLIIGAAFVFAGTKFENNFVDVLTSANAMKTLGQPNMGAIVAIILLNASIVGACAVTLSTSYAFGDTFKVNHSLHRKLMDAKIFYGSYAALLALAGGIVLIPNAPLGLLTLAVQALAGILLPSATVFLVLLSLILATTTFFTLSNADTIKLAVDLGIVLVVALIVMGVVALVQRRGVRSDSEEIAVDKGNWHMPPLTELTKPVWSMTRKVGMLTLRLYLMIAVILMVIKVVQLAIGH